MNDNDTDKSLSSLEKLVASHFPDAQWLSPWKDVSEYESSTINPLTLKAKSVVCANKTIYPAHPQQNLKLYHFYRWAKYETGKLSFDSPACLVHTRNSKKTCISSDIAYYVILSEMYKDSCGQYYRGFTLLPFLKKKETMETLIAPGRTLVTNPANIYEKSAGDTLPLTENKFYLLTEPFPGDKEKSQQLAKQALGSTHYRDRKDPNLFRKK